MIFKIQGQIKIAIRSKKNEFIHNQILLLCLGCLVINKANDCIIFPPSVMKMGRRFIRPTNKLIKVIHRNNNFVHENDLSKNEPYFACISGLYPIE